MPVRRRGRKEPPNKKIGGPVDPLLHISIPTPFSIEKLCRNVADHRGRPLIVEPMRGVTRQATDVCGIWVELENTDCIFYEAATTPLHRDHIVLHEIGHMLLGHTDKEIDVKPAADFSDIFTGISPDMVRKVLGRANFSTPQEREAEELANRIASMAGLAHEEYSSDPGLTRLDTALRSE